ncbi:hypothetical protein LOTGIDRAFT_165878 [Lottia gigantea]|uniref:C-type lectin domain-containing protein n=1 Tax=Lottia gigantea TaxID=225164 RepID=V4BHI1_LOTGI|nr:hypothetical protein LOTGIDRAFT_165878 [Lottia gigantea]ESO88139.1 hypothetical protein LOTGIDRAFT_165878 [Lottia gigantea]
MKIQYTTKFIDTHISEILNVSSAYNCLELCRDHGTCKSVGIKTNSMACYLYDGRVYDGLTGTISSDIIYYWQLEPECPTHLGYDEHPTSKICTKYNSTEVTWLEAQKKCEDEGGFLFMVDNPDSQHLMTSYVSSGGILTFLGATDINQEGVWEWFNGVPINQSAFLPGDPNNALNLEHCINYMIDLPGAMTKEQNLYLKRYI